MFRDLSPRQPHRRSCDFRPEAPVNILLTSSGRRTSLVAAFQKAGHPFGARVLAVDHDPLAPACAVADGAFPVPKVEEPSYISTLLDICREQKVGLIIPTIDPDLPILARNFETFQIMGIFVMIGTRGFIDICRDKWRTFQVFKAKGISVPRTWLPGVPDAGLPTQLFLKPRDGSASLNVHPCHRDELVRMLPKVPNAIVQEFLEGTEITIDAFLDLAGRPIHFVPRKRIRTLAGESIQGVTLDMPEVDAWIEDVLGACSDLGARGPLTLQAFLTDRGPVLTEANPRFGGGFPLALAAGGDYPAWILALRRGESLKPKLGEYRRGLFMTRHYTEIFTQTNLWHSPSRVLPHTMGFQTAESFDYVSHGFRG
jgi:carbamoyl-phosphate synthase large subunit